MTSTKHAETTERNTIAGLQARWEQREFSNISTDSRSVKTGDLFIALRGEHFDGNAYAAEAVRKGAWGAVVAREAYETRNHEFAGLRNIIPVQDTLQFLQEFARTHRERFSLPVVGVTGSNGKTTTREMIAAVLQRKGPVLRNAGNLNNHIGVPLTLLQLTREHRSAVIEMGMSGPGEIALLARLALPDTGVITNIGPAHIGFFGSTARVADAKGELLAGLKPGGTAVLNADDAFYTAFRSAFNGRTISFGITNPADVSATDIKQEPDNVGFTLRSGNEKHFVHLHAVGVHNVGNALAAAAASLAVGSTLAEAAAGLEAFRPVAMRSELRTVQGRTVIADFYNANPASMEAAIKTLGVLGKNRKAVAVVGDMLELGDAAANLHEQVGRVAAQEGIDCLIAVGEFAGNVLEGAQSAGMPHECSREAASHREAAQLLRELTQPGDVVLIKGSRGMKMEKILEEF
jgi:UDP-N-acetylmuramoyl-tripeptide--D-alanyl-D-alanine ligase